MTFIVTWRSLPDKELHQASYPSEFEAVRAWTRCHIYADVEPVDIHPEPNWLAYLYGDGATPVRKWPGISYRPS